jgi:site-specific recombinase XerD
MRDHFEPTIKRYLRRWRPTLRPATIQSKGYTLRSFATYLREHHPHLGRFGELERQPHIEPWLEHILYLKPVSRNCAIRTLRLFFEDLIDWQWPEAPPPRLLGDQDIAPEPLYLPRPLPPELDQAVQNAFLEAGSFGAMALLLLRYTGMRIGEMRALPLNAMDGCGPHTFTLRVPVGKTHAERIIPLDARTVQLIERIIAQRACRQNRRLPATRKHLMMIDHWGRHLTQQSYSRIIKELTAHIGSTEPIYCHRLRHTYASELARAGMPVPALMKLLGHKTPKMTMRYVEVAQNDVRQAYDQALTQVRVIRSIQNRTLPTLPVPSNILPQPSAPHQLIQLMEAMICGLETQRRDASDPARAQQLHRFIKRMRKAGYDLQEIF